MTRRVGFNIQMAADAMYADPDGGPAEMEPAEDVHRFANEPVRDAGDTVLLEYERATGFPSRSPG